MKRLLAIVAASWVPFAGAAFKCTDAKGITHIGDTPPPGCKEVMMYEVTNSGKVLREIEPTLTAEQAKVRAAELEKKRAADAIVAEQKRKDLALLSTYASEKEFDVARDRNIEPLKQRITQSEERSKDIDKRVKVVKEEMEFYTAGKKKGSSDGKHDPSVGMATELERLTDEKKQIAKSIEAYNKEIAEIRTKFDADKQRWIVLKKGGGMGKVDRAAEKK